MKWYISMMSGKLYEVSEETVKKLANKKGLLFVSEIGSAINLNSVETIDPQPIFLAQQRRMAKNGRLHDGTKVVKKFGSWYLLSDPNVSIDPAYYPEIAKDEVMSEAEWELKERKTLMAGVPLLEEPEGSKDL